MQADLDIIAKTGRAGADLALDRAEHGGSGMGLVIGCGIACAHS
jgi:hypothetical protein